MALRPFATARSTFCGALILLAIFGFSRMANAGTVFVSPNIYTVAAYPSGIASGDFNNDGMLDLVTSSRTKAAVSVLLGLGNGRFKQAVEYKTGSNPYAVTVADIDLDGKLDLITANSGASGVSILLGTGDGKFRKPKNTPVVGGPRSVGVGDFNGDGIPDLVTGDYRTSQATILLGRGDGTFGSTKDIQLQAQPTSVAVADFNADNNLDIAIAVGNGTDILLGQGDGTFQPSVHYSSFSAQTVVVGDFNEDGHPDLALGSTTANIGLLIGSASGVFLAAPSIPVAYWTTTSIATASLNHDRHLDLVVADSAESVIYCLLGNGDASFQAPASYSVDEGPQGIAVGDFNGDQKTDVATANGNVASRHSVDVFLGNGNGLVRGERTYRVDLGNFDIAVADFNNDGKLDLLAPASYFQIATHTLLNAGSGSFTDVVSTIPGYTVAAGDFNGDGKADVAIASTTLDIWLGNGDGTFHLLTSYPTGQFDAQIIARDLNHDGILDLAVGMYYEGQVRILLGKGDGTFQLKMDVQAGGVYGLASGDFNHDGIQDIAAGVWYQNIVNVLLGKGDGTFQPAVSYDAGSEPFWVVSGDLNRDGIDDLVVSNFAGAASSVSVLIAKSDGTFLPPIPFYGLTDAGRLAIGDFNGDGLLDIAAPGDFDAINGDFRLGVFLGNGDGTLNPPQFYPLVYSNQIVVPGDFNNDGRDDLAAGDAVSVTVLLTK